MATYTASGLGWTPGTDVSSAFASFLSGTASAGDTLTLDSTTQFVLSTYNHTLPANFTLEAENEGGFAIESTTGLSNPPVFIASAGVTFDNIKLTYPDTPRYADQETWPNNQAVVDTDHHNITGVRVNGDGVTFHDCQFIGQVTYHIESHQEDDLRVEYCLFQGGKYQVELEDADDPRFYKTHFERPLFDCVKTVPEQYNGDGVRGVGMNAGAGLAMFEECVFKESPGRDAIDVTGGLRSAQILNCFFYRIGILADLKCFWQGQGNEKETMGIYDVSFKDCHSIDGGGLVTTTLCREPEPTWMTPTQWTLYGPRNIVIEDSILEWRNMNNAAQRWYLAKSGSQLISRDNTSIIVAGQTSVSYQAIRQLYNEPGSSAYPGGDSDGNAPTGWSPDISPSITNITESTTATSVDPDDFQWARESGGLSGPVADSGLYRFIASAYDDTPGTPFTFIGRCEVDNQFNTSAISFPQGNWTDKVGGTTPLSGLASNSKVAVIVTMKGAQGPNPSGLTIGGVTATKRVDAPSPNNLQDCNTSIWEATASGSFANDTITITGTDRSGDASAIEVFLLDSSLSFQTGLGSNHVEDGGTNDSPTLTTTCAAGDKLLGNYVCLNNDDAPGVTSGASLFPSANNPQGHPSGMRRVSFTNTNASANQAVQLTRASGVTDQAACVAVYR